MKILIKTHKESVITVESKNYKAEYGCTAVFLSRRYVGWEWHKPQSFVKIELPEIIEILQEMQKQLAKPTDEQSK